MVLIVVVVTVFIQTCLVGAAFLHGFGRRVRHRHASHQIRCSIKRIVDVLELVA